MIYDIVLKDGQELNCWTENIENVIEMMFKHSIFIVRENEHPDKATYIMPEQVSHYRFPVNNIDVGEPV